MASCAKCGRKATVAYNRIFHVIPHERRLFCEHCFNMLWRREEIVMIGSLFGLFFAVVVAIVIVHFSGKSRLAENERQISAYYDENDLNRDGRVDFWESLSTPEMKENLKTYGYPWKMVFGPGSTGSPVAFIVNRKEIMELAVENDFTSQFNFPGLMKSHFDELTKPDSLKQLVRIFVTVDHEVVFLVHWYDRIPEGGFEKMFSDPNAKKIEPTDSKAFLESLLESRIQGMFGLADKTFQVKDNVLTRSAKKKA